MSLVDLLTSPAAEQYDTMMKVIDRANKMQLAISNKAERMRKGAKATKKRQS